MQNLSGLLRGHSLVSRSDVINPKERPKRDHEFETSCCKSQFQVAHVFMKLNR